MESWLSAKQPRSVIPGASRLPWQGFGGFAIDLATTLAVLWAGLGHGLAHVAGMTAHVLTAVPADGRAPALRDRLVPVLLALFVRGGLVASLLGWGVPAVLASAAGAAASGVLLAAVRAMLDSGTVPHRHRPAMLLLVAGFALRLAYLGALPLLPEEAYYAGYAEHLDWGYLDHPPLVAWLIAFGESLAGHSAAALRVPSVICGAIAAGFVYALARRLVDPVSGRLAAALTAVLPYFLAGSGLVMTPDAALIAAWAATLYYCHRAVFDEGRGWLAAGFALGLGLLSKYTIALLVPAAFLFLVLDRRARHWLLRPQPYLGLALAAMLFAPVVLWNLQHDWASFRFQAWQRFDDAARFGLHWMLLDCVALVTPLPLLVLPMLLAPGPFRPDQVARYPIEQPRHRLFLACFAVVPLAVFGVSALAHPPRLNWTGPVWLAVLPLLAFCIVHHDQLRWRRLGTALRIGSGPFLFGVLLLIGGACYYTALGFPGVGYPKSFARSMGWDEAAAELQSACRALAASGTHGAIVGMDKYFTASQLAFHAASLPAPCPVTSQGPLFGGNGLMYRFWDDPRDFSGHFLILVARHRHDLEREAVVARFGALGPIEPLLLRNTSPAATGVVVDHYYYRAGHDYRPPPPGR